MTNVYSPLGPPRRLTPRSRRCSRNTINLLKRRKLAHMDSTSQHAFVACFEEPTFEPSAIASLLTSSTSPVTFSQSSSTQGCGLDCVGDDNDPSSVRVSTPTHGEGFPTNANLSTRSAQSATIPTGSSSGSRNDYLFNVQSHPDPGETWQEREGHRIWSQVTERDTDEVARLQRFHLSEDSDPSEQSTLNEVEHYYGHQETIQGSQSEEYPLEVHSTLGGSTSSTNTSASDLSIVDAPGYSHDELREFHPSERPILMRDIDALDVSDPRRDYDFMDFMGHWDRLRISSQQDISKVVRVPGEITRARLAEHGTDIQGLNWRNEHLGREKGLTAREFLHPREPKTQSCSNMSNELSMPSELEGERQYRFRSFYPKHRASFTHYQLRNLLSASGRDVFYSTGTKVLQASLACPSVLFPIMSLSDPLKSTRDLRITCLSTSPQSPFQDYRSDQVLLAGGFQGYYAMVDINSESNLERVEGRISHAYDGLVTHIHVNSDRRSGLPRAVFCTNDHQVQLMDIKTRHLINRSSYDHAMNCSASSPDGRLRVLVGDLNEALVTDAERGDILVSLKEHEGNGFACAWSADGRLVATGAEDGKVVIWDARNWSRPWQVFNTVMSCARAVHFTEDGALVVAECDDVVSIYDPKDSSMQQQIRFFGSIAGVALLNGGSEMVFACSDNTVGGLFSFQRAFDHSFDPPGYGLPHYSTFGADVFV